MADELQKISYDITRALVNAQTVAREPALNTGSGDTPAHPELIIKDDGGSPIYFPSSVQLASNINGSSGADKIGVSNNNFLQLTQQNLQDVLEEIDDNLVTVVNAVTPALDDVSLYSTTTAKQTFTVKSGTTFKIAGGGGGVDYINIQQGSHVNFYSDADIVFNPTGSIYLSGVAVYIVDRWLYLHGNESTDGSWRYGYFSGNIVTQYRASGSWTSKETITP